jgi:hypothetical protein
VLACIHSDPLRTFSQKSLRQSAIVSTWPSTSYPVLTLPKWGNAVPLKRLCSRMPSTPPSAAMMSTRYALRFQACRRGAGWSSRRGWHGDGGTAGRGCGRAIPCRTQACGGPSGRGRDTRDTAVKRVLEVLEREAAVGRGGLLALHCVFGPDTGRVQELGLPGWM